MTDIAQTKAQLTREIRIEEMKRIWIHCPDRNRSLWELSKTEGVISKVEYLAEIGKPTGSCDNGGWKIETKRTDTGLIFGNGMEICGVDEKFFNFFKNVEITERKERV